MGSQPPTRVTLSALSSTVCPDAGLFISSPSTDTLLPNVTLKWENSTYLKDNYFWNLDFFIWPFNNITRKYQDSYFSKNLSLFVIYIYLSGVSSWPLLKNVSLITLTTSIIVGSSWLSPETWWQPLFYVKSMMFTFYYPRKPLRANCIIVLLSAVYTKCDFTARVTFKWIHIH